MSGVKVLDVLHEVHLERIRQDQKFGMDRTMPNGTGGPGLGHVRAAAQRACFVAFDLGNGTWRHILQEEVAEAFAESDPARLREELVQIAAVAVAWIEGIDRDAA